MLIIVIFLLVSYLEISYNLSYKIDEPESCELSGSIVTVIPSRKGNTTMTSDIVANSTAIPQLVPDLHALSEQLQIPVHILRWVDQHLGAVTRLNARIRQFRDGFERIHMDPRRYECEWRDREPHTFQPIDPSPFNMRLKSANLLPHLRI